MSVPTATDGSAAITASRWVLRSALGWMAGVVMAIALIIAADSVGIAGTQSPLAVGMGLGVGLLQRRLVGPWLGAAWPWVAATTLGLSLPFAIVDLLPRAGVAVPYSLGAYVAAGGALAGVLQWRLLWAAGFERAAWWAVLTPVGWILAGSMVSVAQWLPRSLGPIAAVFYLAIVMSGGLFLGVSAAIAWRQMRRARS